MGKRRKAPVSVEELRSHTENGDEETSNDLNTKTGGKVSAKKHKQSLQKLKETDPEFFQFLEKEDKELLSFDPEDIDSSEDSSDDEDSTGGRHVLPQKLEVATDSEESESESEAQPQRKTKRRQVEVTVKMVRSWAENLRGQNSLTSFQHCVSALRAAVQQNSTDDTGHSKYKVEGSSVFNAVVRVCVLEVLPMLNKFLKLETKSKNPNKPPLPFNCPKWSKVKVDVKSYLSDFLQLLSQMSEVEVINVILKHIHQLVLYYVCVPTLNKAILKKLVNIWSSGEETSRVLAFLSIIKLTRLSTKPILESVMKQLYLSFVRNSKFTSPNTLPLINFMQRSLVEVFSIDLTLSYRHAFVYIRQLAIHLRNAITVKKKDTLQAVYNWQFIHSLHLWARLLCQSHTLEALRPLVYPLTQVIIGTIKLESTARYFPLRFHCVRTLNMLSEATDTYIPTLPFLTEIFQLTDFNKKHKSTSFKPLNFSCILKLSMSQLTEKAFKDGVIDQLYDLLLQSFAIHSHSIGFPELVVPPLLQLKGFVKKCKIANYTKVMKQLVDKVQANSDLVAKKRRASGLKLTDKQGIEAFERNLKMDGTPLSKHYTEYKKKRVSELTQEIAGKERISSENLPTIIRRPTATDEDRKEFKGLFGSDSESDSDDSTRFLLKEERPAKKRKDSSDEYSDFDDDELEALDRSASENDNSDDDNSGTGDESDEESDEEHAGDMDVDTVIDSQEDIVEDFQLSDSD